MGAPLRSSKSVPLAQHHHQLAWPTPASTVKRKPPSRSWTASSSPSKESRPLRWSGLIVCCSIGIMIGRWTASQSQLHQEIMTLTTEIVASSILETLPRSRDNNELAESQFHFNGFPLVRVNDPPSTVVHCAGDNLWGDGWVFRSCEYKTFCYDIDRERFVVYLDEEPLLYMDEETNHPYYHSHSATNPNNYTMHVWAGAQAKSWMPWIGSFKRSNVSGVIGLYKPKVRIRAGNNNNDQGSFPKMYYLMPNTVMLNFFRHGKSYKNPGHLIFDDFLPMYTLLDSFDLLDKRLFLAEMNRTIRALGYEPAPRDGDLIRKFLPLMGEHHQNYNIQTYTGFELSDNVQWPNDGRDRVVCASHGVMGNGMFSDHGHDHWHGQARDDYDRPHNNGRAGLFRRFRSFLMRNVGIDPDSPIVSQPSFQMIVAQNSSAKDARTGVGFDQQIRAVRAKYGSKIRVVPVVLAELSLIEQVNLARTSAFFVSVCGGGTATSIFMPEGAALMLYSDDPKLDWDFYNNFFHLRMHWMPRVERMDNETEMNFFLDLVGRELKRLDRQIIGKR